ncbi:hypothetical protein ES707_08059 [subsurface metagenome]
MADYLAPFHLPKFTDDKFEEEKQKYIAKNGYTVTFPGLEDIIHIGIVKPQTDDEKQLYRAGRKWEIPKNRQLELETLKTKKKERLERMMASPTPRIAQAYASIMQAVDDTQDALITLAAIGRIAMKVLPKFLSRFLAGPIGWLWLLSELMNGLMAPTSCMIRPRKCKRALKRKLRGYPKHVRAKMKAYPHSGKIFPSFSEGIQALQVTKDVYGWGLSLGPIIGLATDLASGAVRWAIGQKVTFEAAPGYVEIYRKAADKVNNYARFQRPKEKMDAYQFHQWKAQKQREGTWGYKRKEDDMIAAAIKMHTTYGGIVRKTDYMEEALLYASWEILQTGVLNILDEWNPLTMVEGLEHIETEAPRCDDPITEEIFREKGMDPDDYVSWPSLGKRWATYDEISRSVAPIAAENFRHFEDTCPDLRLNTIVGHSVTNGSHLAMENIEGPGSLELEYHAGIDITEMLLDKGYSFPKTITAQQIYDLGYWMIAHQENESRPTLDETLGYAKNSLDFEFITNP